MGIELVIIAFALIAVLITNGSLKKLFTTHFSHVWALVFVLAGHLAILFAPIPESQNDTVGLGILLGTYVFLFGFCIANLDKFGMYFVLAGSICNALVIGLNKGMPVTTSGGFEVEETIKHQAATNNDLLPWLGDILPINAVSVAISVGDILIALGILSICVVSSRKDKKQDVTSSEASVIPSEAETGVKESNEEIESALDEITSSIGTNTDEVPIVMIEDHHSSTTTIVDEEEEDDVVIDLTHEEQVAMLEESYSSSDDEGIQEMPKKMKAYKGTKRTSSPRSSRRWRKTHGLNALPSKEELGYDDTSMEIVEAAE